MNHVLEYDHNKQTIRQEKKLPKEVEEVINYCWDEMKMAKKSWKKELKTPEDIKRYLKGLGKALMINRIDSMDKLMFGLEYMYMDESEWLPSAGMFARWCKDGYNQHLKQKQLLDNANRISDERRQISSDTFEERQKTAREELNKIRKNLGAAK